MFTGKTALKYANVKTASHNGIPCSLYIHRVLDKGWDENRASTEPPSSDEKFENKHFNKRLMI